MASFRRARMLPDQVSLVKPVEHANARAVVAAATRAMPVALGGAPLRISTEAWTMEAWRQYDICGELGFATRWLANSVSRCKLTICEIDASGNVGAPTKSPEVLAIGAGLLMNPGMQSELLLQAAKNLTIAGDGWILGEPNPLTGQFDDWCFLSTYEVQRGLSNEWIVNLGDGEPRIIDILECLLIRVHRPHPRVWWQADSPTRGALPILRELEELSKYLFATINSRLAGAGILAMPTEITFPDPQGELQPGETPFMATLAEGMLAPIEDMGNVSALVPIVVQAPAAYIASMQWITNPNTQLPAQIESLREAAIKRLALSLDLSPDTLFGSGNSSRWGQWTLEEQSVKFHVEPVMILITSALTNGYLTPALLAANLLTEGGPRYVYSYDPSDLVQRSDQSASALNLYDRGELSGEALRRESGFNELDAPTGTEAQVRDLLKILALSPQSGDLLIPELGKLLGINIDLSLLATPPNGTPPQVSAPNPNETPGRPEPKAAPEPKATPNKNGSPATTKPTTP